MDNEQFITRLKQYGDVTYTDSGEVQFKVKPASKECQFSCGAVIPGQEIEIREYTKPATHIKKKCLFCKKWQLPNGEMSADHEVISAAFDKQLRRTGRIDYK